MVTSQWPKPDRVIRAEFVECVSLTGNEASKAMVYKLKTGFRAKTEQKNDPHNRFFVQGRSAATR
ncbi:MAG: hypothetical protein CMM01_21590 [Rhodopirellula sp.]|nr:hypothetical protein [Rhodopirellula sp.]